MSLLARWEAGWRRNSRETDTEAGEDGELLGLVHLELPDDWDGQDDDHQVRDDVGHNDALENEDLVHAVTDAVNGPLLFHRVAEEDEDQGEDKPPHRDNRAEGEDPDLELAPDRPVVEA